MPTRWGIAGTGLIANDFAFAIKAIGNDGHLLKAVGSRALDDAQDFANKHGIKRAYGSYEELADDTGVEVVYVATIHPCHLPVAKLMIKAGKHVLCEKPLCMNVKETKELIDLARKKKVFLMEALWSRFFPVYKNMMEMIKKEDIGEVKNVMCSMGQCRKDVDRAVKKELGGGSSLDLGVHCVQFVSLIMGGEKPENVLAVGHLNAEGVDENTSATIVYSDKRIASVNTSITCKLPCEATVVGTKGVIKIPKPFWCPDCIESPFGKCYLPLPDYGKRFNFKNGQGMMYEAAEVRQCLKEGLLESPSITLDETLTIAEIVETIRKQVGVEYPQDD